MLANVQAQQPQQKGRSGQKSAQDLSLEGEYVVEWNIYVKKLVAIFVQLDEDEQDKLIWTKNAVNGEFIAKKGYDVANFEQTEGEKRWWWGQIWGIHDPLKTIITLQLAL